MKSPGRARAALLCLAAAGALTSCSIPTTGVVQAGGPTGGVTPMTPVYFVRDGALVGVRRPTDAPGDVGAALEELLGGPNDVERGAGLTTRLARPSAVPTAVPSATSATVGGTTGVPPVAGPEDAVTVTERDGGIFVELSGPVAGSDGARLAAAQIVCTADAAQRIAAPDAEPRPVAVTARDGRRIGKTSAHCPAV